MNKRPWKRSNLFRGLILIPGAIVSVLMVGISRIPLRLAAGAGLVGSVILGLLWLANAVLIALLEESLFGLARPGLMGLSLLIAAFTALRGWRLRQLL